MELSTLDNNLIQEDKMFNEENIATAGRRFLNMIIDMVVVYFVYFAILVLYVGLKGFNPEAIFDVVLLIYVIMFAYYIILEGAYGKTLGKLITKTKVIKIDGEKPTYSSALLRTLCRLIPFEVFSFFGSPCAGWHDTITNTRVVLDK